MNNTTLTNNAATAIAQNEGTKFYLNELTPATLSRVYDKNERLQADLYEAALDTLHADFYHLIGPIEKAIEIEHGDDADLFIEHRARSVSEYANLLDILEVDAADLVDLVDAADILKEAGDALDEYRAAYNEEDGAGDYDEKRRELSNIVDEITAKVVQLYKAGRDAVEFGSDERRANFVESHRKTSEYGGGYADCYIKGADLVMYCDMYETTSYE